MRGILSGIVAGTALGAVAVLVASQFAPKVELPVDPPRTGSVEVPPGSQFSAERPDAPPILPGTEGRPGSADVPMVDAPELAPEGLPDPDPLAAPDAGDLTEGELSPPAVPPAPEIVVSGGTDAVLPERNGSGVQPEAPPAGGPDLAAEAPPASDPVTTPETGDVSGEVMDAPAVPPAPEIALGGEPEAARPDPLAEAAPRQPQPDQPDAAIDAGSGAAADRPAAAVEPALPGSDTEVAELSQAPVVTIPEPPQGLRLPVPEIEDQSPGVSGSLPRIGAEAVDPDLAALPALTRNAVPFEAAAGNPLMAMILFDAGEVRPTMEQLAEFPIPLAVALDPTAPEAPALMQGYRDAGLEVVALAPVPEGADPADVEVAFQGYFNILPLSVAVLDVPDADLQASRPRAAQVVDILAETGHGLITYDRAFNAGLQIADQAGVAARLVYRSIDPAGKHDIAAMKRFLDQAAFKAGQDGTVILTADMRPETLAALAEWTLGTRAASVTLAPVSAVLKAK